MSLSAKKQDIQLSPQGTFTFDIPKDKKPGGTWVMLASYTDKGADGASPIRSYNNVVLKSPFISAVNFEAIDISTKMTITPEMNPALKEPMDIVIAMHNGVVTYGEIDLSGIGNITFSVIAPAAFVGGGVIEFHIDALSDTPAAVAEVKLSKGNAPDNYSVKLPEISGKHKVLLRTRSSDSVKPVGLLIGMTVQPRLSTSAM